MKDVHPHFSTTSLGVRLATEWTITPLLNRLLSAVVLAPFFVHLEILFAAGYRPQFHKELENDIGKEVAKFRKEQGDAKRAAAKKN